MLRHTITDVLFTDDIFLESKDKELFKNHFKKAVMKAIDEGSLEPRLRICGKIYDPISYTGDSNDVMKVSTENERHQCMESINVGGWIS